MDPFWASICEALLCASREMSELPSHQQSLQQTAEFLQAQLLALPLTVRVGARIGLAALRAYTRLTFFRRFDRLDRERRIAVVQRWASAPLPLARQLMRALRQLALLGYFDAGQRPAAAPCQRPRKSDEEMTTEVIIIGSGAGGAVTALELASRGHQVLIVEEGHAVGRDPAPPGSIESVKSLYRRRGMTPISGRVPIAYVEGCCVGGSTELNSGFWHRPPAETLLRWKAQYDLDAATPQELRPHWEWAEQALGVRLHDGPLPMSSQVFARGADALNWSVVEVARTAAHARDHQPRCPGEPAGGGVGRSLIPQATASGAKLLTGYRADRLEVNGSRVIGARLLASDRNGGPPAIRVRADHVFVCAGATETPALLRRSGFTHRVGDSLRIHPMLKVAARFNERIDAEPSSVPLLQVREFAPEIVLGGAYFSRAHLAAILCNSWAETGDRIAALDRMACYYVGVRGTGRGRVRPSRMEYGRTHVHYELSDEDIRNLSRGVARLSALLLAGGAVEVLPAVCHLPPIVTPVQAARWLDDRLEGRDCSVTTVHAFSSCPIGERRDRCAADSFGKVHGADNLYINDASMIPDTPGVNPQGTIMTLARRNAQHFADARRG